MERVTREIIGVGAVAAADDHRHGLVSEGENVGCPLNSPSVLGLLLVKAADVESHHAVAVGLDAALVGPVA